MDTPVASCCKSSHIASQLFIRFSGGPFFSRYPLGYYEATIRFIGITFYILLAAFYLKPLGHTEYPHCFNVKHSTCFQALRYRFSSGSPRLDSESGTSWVVIHRQQVVVTWIKKNDCFSFSLLASDFQPGYWRAAKNTCVWLCYFCYFHWTRFLSDLILYLPCQFTCSSSDFSNEFLE